MEDLVYMIESGEVVTDSMKVADKFHKPHKNVLMKIRNVIASAKKLANLDIRFELISYTDRWGREMPLYIMNRDAFTMLAMSFVGEEANMFKMAYIAAFNAMEKHIKEEQKAIAPETMSLTPAEALLNSVQLLVEQEKRLAVVEKKIEASEKEREESKERLLALELSDNITPEESMRSKIVRAVNTYCSANNVSQQDFWHRLYKDLYYIDHIRIDKEEGRSKLDVCERRGLLNIVWDRVSNIIRGC